MSQERHYEGVVYKDILLFLVLIPCINTLNYYLTYKNIQFNGHTALTFIIDTIQGYLAWMVIRSIILLLDKKLPYSPKPLKRIIIQLLLTSFAGLAVIIITTEIINWTVKDTPVPLSFYQFDIFIFIIWFFVLNGIYVGWYYYIRWNDSEKMRQEEKKIRQDGFAIRSGKQNLNLSFSEIAGIYVEGDYAILVTTNNKKHLLDQSLDRVEKLLPSELFFRVNRQFILHRNKISGYEREENGKLNIMITSSGLLPQTTLMSRTKAPAFKIWFQHEK
ncbi:MAG TPA: LytTR family DNA-binding domain-containing protein [Puia sp.]|nr:LytTR family DNA-binding domain-containing protein [Puia sp.]